MLANVVMVCIMILLQSLASVYLDKRPESCEKGFWFGMKIHSVFLLRFTISFCLIRFRLVILSATDQKPNEIGLYSERNYSLIELEFVFVFRRCSLKGMIL